MRGLAVLLVLVAACVVAGGAEPNAAAQEAELAARVAQLEAEVARLTTANERLRQKAEELAAEVRQLEELVAEAPVGEGGIAEQADGPSRGGTELFVPIRVELSRQPYSRDLGAGHKATLAPRAGEVLVIVTLECTERWHKMPMSQYARFRLRKEKKDIATAYQAKVAGGGDFSYLTSDGRAFACACFPAPGGPEPVATFFTPDGRVSDCWVPVVGQVVLVGAVPEKAEVESVIWAGEHQIPLAQ